VSKENSNAVLSLISFLKKRQSFIMYITIGVVGLVWEMLLFTVLFGSAHVPYAIANVFAMWVAITHNFLLNAFLNFKKTDRIWSRYITFLSVGAVGIIVSDTILVVAHEMFNLPILYIKLATIPVIAIVQYMVNKKFSFKK